MCSKIFTTYCVLASLLLTSCAANLQDQEVDWKHGAKRGWIVKFYTPDSATADVPECQAALLKTDISKRHFVMIDYRHVRQVFSTSAELPPDELQPKLNDQVEFWPGNCSYGKFARITRILPPHPR